MGSWKPQKDLIDRIYADLAATSVKKFEDPDEVLMYGAVRGKLVLSHEMWCEALPPKPKTLDQQLNNPPPGWMWMSGTPGQTRLYNGMRRMEYFVHRASDQVSPAALILSMENIEKGVPTSDDEMRLMTYSYKMVGNSLVPDSGKAIMDGKIIEAKSGAFPTPAVARSVLSECVGTANLQVLCQTGMGWPTAYTHALKNQLCLAKRWLPLPHQQRLEDMLIIHPSNREQFPWLPWNLLVEDPDGESYLVDIADQTCPKCGKGHYEGWVCNNDECSLNWAKSPSPVPHGPGHVVHLRCILCKEEWLIQPKKATLPNPVGWKPHDEEEDL